MKEFWKSWKFWLAVVAIILAIVAVVLYFTKPIFCYFVSGFLIGGLAGFLAAWLIQEKSKKA